MILEHKLIFFLFSQNQISAWRLMYEHSHTRQLFHKTIPQYVLINSMHLKVKILFNIKEWILLTFYSNRRKTSFKIFSQVEYPRYIHIRVEKSYVLPFSVADNR